MKIKISRKGSTSVAGNQRDYGLITSQLSTYNNYRSGKGVTETLSGDPEDEATIEAERGETIAGDLSGTGMVEHAKIGGKKHYEGGTPLDAPEGAFVFSDTAKMKIKNEELLKMFGSKSTKPQTPADLAKKFDLNKYNDILNNPESSFLEQKTAQLMLDGNMKKLGQLALVQEGMKGFPNGIPDIALPLFGSDVAQQQEQEEQTEQQFAKHGGPVKYQTGRQVMLPPGMKPQDVMPRNPDMVYQTPQVRTPGTSEYNRSNAYNMIVNPGNAFSYFMSPQGSQTGTSFDSYMKNPNNNNPVSNVLTGAANVMTAPLTIASAMGHADAQQSSNPNAQQAGWTDGLIGTLLTAAVIYGGGKATSAGLKYLFGNKKAWVDFMKGIPPHLKSSFETTKEFIKKNPAIIETGKFAGILAGTSLAKSYINEPDVPVFSSDEFKVIGDTIPEEPIVQEYLEPVENEYQRAQEELVNKMVIDTTSQPVPADTTYTAPAPRRKTQAPTPTEAPVQSQKDIRAMVRSTIAQINGIDESDVTEEMIDTQIKGYKLGGQASLPKHQMQGEVVYDTRDKEAIDAALAKNLKLMRPWSYYNDAVSYVGPQRVRTGTHEVTPQGIIQKKGSKQIDINELKRYPIDWSSYGTNGFEDFKKDIAASKGKESKASKWWVDKVNDYSTKMTGKTLFDTSKPSVYVPGYEWSTPGFYEEIKNAPVAEETIVERKIDEAIPPQTQFDSTTHYGLGEPFPGDVAGLISAGGMRIPQYGTMLDTLTPHLTAPVYQNPNLEPLAAVQKAVENMGVGPNARASATGVAGQALDIGSKIIAQNRAQNDDMFLKTNMYNAGVLNQAETANMGQRAAYMNDLNAFNESTTRDLNAKSKGVAENFAKTYNNMLKQLTINAQFPYQHQTPYGISVNPTLRSIYDEPNVGGGSGSQMSNLEALFNNYYDKMIRSGVSPADASTAASKYVSAMTSGNRRGTGNTMYSPFDIY